MTIDEAIENARNVAKRNREQLKNCPADRIDIEHQTCEQCAEEYEQLAVWLEELKDYRNKNKMVVCIDVENIDTLYNKAINDFAKALTTMYEKYDIDDVFESSDTYSYTSACYIFEDYIYEIAEQLKAGEQNEQSI